jgi:hypothetical protein
MGNCICLVRNIDDFSPDIYNKILLSFSYNLNIDYNNTLYIDELYNWNGIPLVRINEQFLTKCIQYKKINIPYIITKKDGQFIINFNMEFYNKINRDFERDLNQDYHHI